MDRTVKRVNFINPKIPKRLRVAAYARVSCGKDAMRHSLAAQVSYYSSLIQSRTEWQYIGVYADEAKTGTKDTREDFKRLIADCRAGNIDLVITKSISRFARNTITLLSAVRELKELGVDVFFEEQNIHTLSADGELMLTILASYAQEESRSVSENMKWRIRKGFKEGTPWNIVIYGYRFENGKFVKEPREAEVVQDIFKFYLSGLGYAQIAKKLNSRRVPPMYNGEWSPSSVRHILTHYIYTGSLLLQRYYSENHITKKTLTNSGELPMYHAADTHEAIVSEEMWNEVQAEMERRTISSGATHDSKSHYPFTGKIVCGCCGKHYRRKMKRGRPFWICSTYNSKGKRFCPTSKAIPEDVLEAIVNDDIEHITAKENNILILHLNNGSSVEKTWIDRSRAESWTDEMKAKAREKELERRKQSA